MYILAYFSTLVKEVIIIPVIKEIPIFDCSSLEQSRTYNILAYYKYFNIPKFRHKHSYFCYRIMFIVNTVQAETQGSVARGFPASAERYRRREEDRVPVSYTHLDVYKRQVRIRLQCSKEIYS